MATRASARHRVLERVVPGLVMASPIVLVLLLQGLPGLDLYHHNAHFHLWIVTAIAGSAAIVGTLAGAAAVRSRQPGALWLSVGCTATAVLMFGHGFMTPG